MKRLFFASSLAFAAATGTAEPLDTWHVREVPSSAVGSKLNGVAFGSGRWVAVGEDGLIISSPDGVTWKAETNPQSSSLEDVLFGNGLFVAFGSQWNNFLTSPDGEHWTRQTPNFSGGFEMIYDGTRFLSVLAGGFVVTSTNAVNWTTLKRCPAKYDIGGIAYGNGIYVEAGYKRTGTPPDLYTTLDLDAWTQRDSKATENLMNVAFGVGQFIAVGQKGTITTSPNGIDWTPRTSSHTGFIWDVATDGQHLVAAAQWGRVLTSTDGTNWAVHETDLPWHLTDVAYGNGTFVAVGWEGQIVQSDPVSQPEAVVQLSKPAKNGAFKFDLHGQEGQTYVIQSSADLNTWNNLTTVKATASAAGTPVSDAGTGSVRFYRAVKH